MCSGTGTVSTPGVLPQSLQKQQASMMGGPPDLTDQAVLLARRAAMRQLAVKRGLQSTFVTTPQAGSMLGGVGGS